MSRQDLAAWDRLTELRRQAGIEDEHGIIWLFGTAREAMVCAACKGAIAKGRLWAATRARTVCVTCWRRRKT